MLYLEHATATGIPFIDPELLCERCEGRWHPDDVEDGRCPSCESTSLVDDRIGALDFVGDELGGGDTTYRVLVREHEAPEFFERLDSALRVNFGVRLASLRGCDDAVRGRIGVCAD